MSLTWASLIGSSIQAAAASRLASLHPKSVVCRCLLQSLWVYFSWAMLIWTLPLSWVPWSSQGSNVAHVQRMADFSWALSFLWGAPASFDCLLQSWDIWADCDMQSIVSSVFFRAVAR